MISKHGAVLAALLTVATAFSTSPDGSCGKDNKYSCIGFDTGNCCSEYGWCGSSDGHCGTGCQADYGTCNQASLIQSASPSASLAAAVSSIAGVLNLSAVGSSAVSAVSSAVAGVNATAKVSAISASVSSANAAASSAVLKAQTCTCAGTVAINPICPTNTGACYTINKKTFAITCGGLANGTIIGYPPVISLGTCLSLCSTLPACIAVSYDVSEGAKKCALLSSYSGPVVALGTDIAMKSVGRLTGSC